MPAIDHLRDPLKSQFVAFSYEYDIPEFVKNASDVQLSEPALTVHNAYALPARKALPLHTKAAAWLSAVYLDANVELTSYERKVATSNLKRAFDVFGMPWPEKKETASEPQPVDADYLISFEKNGAVHRRMPVRNPDEAKVAVAYLQEHRLELPVETRKQASERLLIHLAKFAVEVKAGDAERLQKDACQCFVHSDDLHSFLSKRASMSSAAGFTEVGAEFRKAAEAVKGIDSILDAPDLLVEVFSTVEELERKLNIPKYAAVDQIDVIAATHVEDYLDKAVVMKSGHLYQSSDDIAPHVSKIPDLNINEIKPDGLTVDTVKLAAALENLTEERANAVALILKKAGVEANIFLPPETGNKDEDWRILAGS